MTNLTAKLFSLAKFAPYAKLAGLGVALLLAACGDPSGMDAMGDLDGLDVSAVPAEYDGLELVAVDAEPLYDLGVEEVGDVWVDDCNICMLTEDGPACTIQACEDVDPEAPYDLSITCEDGEYQGGEIWQEACNMCKCTVEGTVCTAKACDPESLPH